MNGNGGGEAKAIAHGELHDLFTIGHAKHRIVVERCNVMPSNKHHTLGLSPFKKSGCTKAIHSMHDHVEFYLDNGKTFTLTITLTSNSLDFVSLKIMPPAS